MPLHDWSDLGGWEGVHDYWLVELARCIKAQLPAGYRAYLGSSPYLKVGKDEGKPDVSVHHSANGNGVARTSPSTSLEQPDSFITTFALDPELAIMVTRQGALVAAVEIISPRNKDRPGARTNYTGRYLGYLNARASLMIVDVHPQPFGFSFADALAVELDAEQPPLPAPMTISIRDGGAVPDRGTRLEVWRRPLTPGQPLPTMPLFLSATDSVHVDLETTYARAAADAYIT
ncbi:MAG TPA: DUF4058 family protein [Gemmataceae bacterium]|jgi:hypothetical protein|nr:DUF4058 family protein [Gemmataceae bacterium]